MPDKGGRVVCPLMCVYLSPLDAINQYNLFLKEMKSHYNYIRVFNVSPRCV